MDCNSGCNSGCHGSAPCPCPEHGNPAIDSLEKLINCYWQGHQQYDVERTWYSSLETLEMAIHDAALALADENSDLDHIPDRISLTELATAKQRMLDAADRISQLDTFEDLFSVIEGCLADLSGIDSDLVYLTALRIGMQAGLDPQHIFLHDETREGALQLVDVEAGSTVLEKSQLPQLLQHPDLPAAIIQGCLSVCRHQLKWLRALGALS